MRKITIGFQINGDHIDSVGTMVPLGTIWDYWLPFITIWYHRVPLSIIENSLVPLGTIIYHCLPTEAQLIGTEGLTYFGTD